MKNHTAFKVRSVYLWWNILVLGLFFCASTSRAVFICLDGTSSAGKSSICNVLRNQEQWGVVASLYWDWAQYNLAKLFSNDFALIQEALPEHNITHTLRRNIVFLKKGITQRQREDALQAIEKIRSVLSNQTDSELYDCHMKEFKDFSLNALKESLACNEHVLFDGSWYADLDSLEISCKKYSVLVYCSFQEMVHRIVGRRKKTVESGNVIQHRFFCEGMRAFLKLYTITPERDGAIDTIDKAGVREALKLVESLLESSPSSEKKRFIVQEFSREQFEQFRQDLLAQFEQHETLYLVPKNTYDLVLVTDQTNPNECARKIIDLFS